MEEEDKDQVDAVSNNTQARYFDFSKKYYSSECFVTSDKINLIHPDQGFKVKVEDFIVGGDKLIISCKDTIEIYNSMTGHRLESFDLKDVIKV